MGENQIANQSHIYTCMYQILWIIAFIIILIYINTHTHTHTHTHTLNEILKNTKIFFVNVYILYILYDRPC